MIKKEQPTLAEIVSHINLLVLGGRAYKEDLEMLTYMLAKNLIIIFTAWKPLEAQLNAAVAQF